jgi:eukaryotic-like serine/threonine-protein kinase
MSSQQRIGWHRSSGRRLRPLHPSLALYRAGGEALREGPANAPYASINYGAAGIAYAMHRLARARGEPELFELASAWVQKAHALSIDPRAFYNPAPGPTPEAVSRVSLFHSLNGLHCVDALVHLSLGDASAAARAINAFVDGSRGPCDSPDVTGGAAGLLLGCAELLESADTSTRVDTESVYQRGDEIASTLTRLLESEEIATSSRLRALGIGHGWAGLLFALLRWARASRFAVSTLIDERLDELADLAIPFENGVRWTTHNNSSLFMPGWCHGTAGYTMLFALAHEMLSVPAYADLVEGAAKSTWSIETPHGSLCCGNGGNGYAFLAAYRVTRSHVWLDRAHAAVQKASDDASDFHSRDALFKGPLGVALLESELDDPSTAAMPLFEPVRSR